MLGESLNDEILMVEYDGLYALPESSMDGLSANNIVDAAHELAYNLHVKAEQISLAYVVKQRIPDNNETIINYYFIMLTKETENIPKGYKWVPKSYEVIDRGIYPKEFVDRIEDGLKNGFLMGAIEVIGE